MQYVDVARKHRGKLARQRIDAEVYRAARHRVFERQRAGSAEWPQPRQAIGKITESLAEEDAGVDRVGSIGADPLGAGVPDAPTQPGGHQRLVQIVAVDCSFDREIRDIESRPLGAAPVAVNPSAVDADPQRWSQQAKKRPTEPVVDDIATLIGAFGACEERQYRFISNGRVVERKRAGKKSVAGDAVSVGETRRGRHRRYDQE